MCSLLEIVFGRTAQLRNQNSCPRREARFVVRRFPGENFLEEFVHHETAFAAALDFDNLGRMLIFSLRTDPGFPLRSDPVIGLCHAW